MIWEAALVSKKVAATGVTVLTILGIAIDQWIAIAVGLLIGVMARWSYLMSTAKPVQWRDVGIDLLAAPMNGILASQLVMTAGLHDERIVLASAMLAAGSTLAFTYAFKRFFKKPGDEPTGHAIPPAAALSPRNASGDPQRVLSDAESPIAFIGERSAPPAAVPGHDPDQDLLDKLPQGDR